MKKKRQIPQDDLQNNKKQPNAYEDLENTQSNVSELIKKMKFRELEEFEIQQFIASHDEQKFLMITGQPGCGKTMLLTKCLKQWQNNYTTIYINAMQCKNYTEFLNICKKQLNVKSSTAKQQTRKVIMDRLKELNTIITIDEFDNLFKVSEKEAFDLFSLSKHAIIIGISNDIEFLQTQSVRYKFQLPQFKNLILKPYTIQQLQELKYSKYVYLYRKYDEKAIKILTTRAYNDKGGDMRNIIDIVKRTLRDKEEFTTDAVNQEIGMSVFDNKMKGVVTTLTLHQQLILLGIIALLKKDSIQLEIDLPDLIRKVNEIKYKLSLPLSVDVEEEINLLKDYNLLTTKEAKQQKMGFKITVKKILCKFTAEELKYQLSDLDAFKNILQQL
ncbi:unnamed protein product (macronuclear) [Paramecium tetraurelia]|uniref:AAA+ ATPase domain-containing protein n=1 Tax=Paramecium tetraurelia TaxID=5888 RepID=A0BVA1_PARTE|nr:uncharacterized protein GSPATT00005714001 [Paramecium tetraurelia]CAK62468.1 unnamed protein product [Paramecium tetraurelia]|eukprot:XP_001429866.1 hypothetical protein (macronuclear) [Paramecium tetraurelia strain d4-2]